MRESRDNIDEYLKNKITKKGSLQIRKKIFHRLTPSHSIPLMPCVSRASQERVLSEETCCGRTSAICIFIDEVTSYNGWGYQFLDALHYTGHDDLAVELYPDYVSPNNGGDGSIDDDDDDNDDNNGNDSGPHLQNIERSSPLPIPNGEVFSDPPPPYQERMTENDVSEHNLPLNTSDRPPPPYSFPSQNGAQNHDGQTAARRNEDRAVQNEKKLEEALSSAVLHSVDPTFFPNLRSASNEQEHDGNPNDLEVMISQPSCKDEATNDANEGVESLVCIETPKIEADGAVKQDELPVAAQRNESDDFDQGHALLSSSSGSSSPEAARNEQSADLIDFSGSVLEPNNKPAS